MTWKIKEIKRIKINDDTIYTLYNKKIKEAFLQYQKTIEQK